MKYKHLNYEQCIQRGLDLVKNYKETKYNICELCLRVCDIQKGGHGNKKEIYSMKNFADRIGIKWTTIKFWMREHTQVVKKIDLKEPPKDYRIIREVLREVDPETPKEKVIQIFNKYNNYSKEEFKLIRAIEDATGVRNFIEDHAISELDQDKIEQLKELLEMSLDTLNKNRIVKKGA